MRRFLKSWIVGLVVGLGLLSGAMAGVGLSPLQEQTTKIDKLRSNAVKANAATPGSKAAAAATHTTPAQVPALAAQKVTLSLPGKLAGGSFLVGADATSLYPTPTLFGGETWQTKGCTELDEGNLDRTHMLPGDGHGWPATSKDCIYLGGFGIGPARAAHEIDDGGVWVRSVAISNGENTVVWQIIDATGYFYAYNASICADCGIYHLKQKISADTGLPADAISIGATHTHAGPDAYGGWGGIPTWYWHQLRDSFVASAKQALLNLEPGTITVGEAILRDFNGERRDHYYSTPDYQATWLQARGTTGNVIATLANYAGHPTIVGDPLLHADWPGAASRRFEAASGGVGLLFEGGLGNVSIRGRGGETDDENAENTGVAFGNAILTDIVAGGTTLTTNDVTTAIVPISHPVSNPVLAAGGILNLFNRDFLAPGPAADLPGAYQWSKTAVTEPGVARSCVTASPVQIKTLTGGHRIGNVLVLFAPGEIFSNISEVAKSKTAGSAMTLVFGQTNDSLGYIIQSFEFDVLSNAVTEYVTETAEYEEFFSIDRCFGDHVIQTMLDAAKTLGF
jgi:hypothetical protein